MAINKFFIFYLTLLALVCTFLATSGQANAGDRFDQAWMRGAVAGFGGAYRSTLSADGKLLAHHSGGFVQITRLSDGMLVDTIQVKNWVHNLAWSKDGRHLFLGGDEELWRYALETREYKLFFTAPELGEVLGISVSPDNTRLAAVGRVNGIESYFMIPLNGSTPSGPYLMPNLEVNKLYWLPDNQRIVVNGPNVFNLTGVQSVTNASTGDAFTVSPDGTHAVQIANRTVRAVRLTDNATLWSANLPSSVFNEWIEYFANGSGIAFMDSDPESRVAVQVFAPGAGFLARVRIRGADRAWMSGFTVVPSQRRIVIPFEMRDTDWSKVESYDANADLSSASLVGTSSPRFSDRVTRLQPTVIAPGTANARPGIAYDYFDQIPKLNILEQSNGNPAITLNRLNGDGDYRTTITADGRYLLHIGRRETGAFGYHVYRTSDNQRVGSFETNDGTGHTDIGSNAVFGVNNSWKVKLFTVNTSTGVVTKSFEFPTDWDAFDLSPDGTRVAHEDSASNELWVTNTANGTRVSRLTPAMTDAVRSFTLVTPTRLMTLEFNGDQLVGALWDLSIANAVQVCRVQIPRPSGTDNCVGAVSPDLKYLALSQGYMKGVWEDRLERVHGKTHIFSVANGSLVATWDDAAPGNYYLDAEWSTDSSTLYLSQQWHGIAALRFPSGLDKVVASPNPVVGGNNSTGTVTLTGTASTALTVTLSSNSDRAVVPASVTIPAGQSSATFTVTTLGVNANTTARITATAGNSVTTDLVITPPTSMTMSVSPSTLTAGASATGTVTVNGKAGSSGIAVALTSSATGVGTVTPATVTIASGASSATFTFKAAASPVGTTTTVTAKSTTPILTASANVQVSSSSMTLTVSPSTIKGGNATLLTITLPSPAPTGGLIVKLVSDNAAVIVPAQITIAAGQSTRAFGIKTLAVTAQRTVNITATATGLSERKAAVIVAPPAVKTVESAFTSVIGGTALTLTAFLDGPAPNPFAIVAGSSDTGTGTVPNSVNVPANNTRIEISLTTKVVTQLKNLTITVGGKTVIVTVLPPP